MMRRLSSIAALGAALVLAAAAAAHARAAPGAAPESDDMVTVPGGSFLMGSSKAQSDAELTHTMILHNADDGFGAWEKPRHKVTVRAFKISRYLVTVGDYDAFVAATGHASAGCYAYNGKTFGFSAAADYRHPGFDQTPRHPALCLSYRDAQAYVAWYAAKTGLAYRLPTEAELEYATRAGTTTSRFWGDDPARQCDYANGPDLTMKAQFPAWYGAPCADGYLLTSPVGAFNPNPWGLYDMVGEVFQYTDDCWADSYAGAPADGSARTTGDCSKRVIRGGSTTSHPGSMTCASRTGSTLDGRSVYVGFRLARSLD